MKNLRTYVNRCGYLSSSTIFLSHYVHKTIVLNKKSMERNGDSRNLEDKMKHLGDNEHPRIGFKKNKLFVII